MHVSSAKQISERLPEVSGADVSGRAGKSVRVTGQYRGTAAASTVSVTIRQPTGHTTTTTVGIGLNGYYSVAIQRLATGTTTVHFAAGNAKARTIKVVGYTAAAPTIESLSAHAGAISGGALVTVHGTNFHDVTAVDFGAEHGRDVRMVSSTELIVRTPTAPAGAGYITVHTKNGGPSPLTGRSIFNFLPRPGVKALSPESGPARGGNTVTIHGLDLAFVQAVYFGRYKATHLRVISSAEIEVTAPGGTGKEAVTVVTAGGRSAAVPGDLYTY